MAKKTKKRVGRRIDPTTQMPTTNQAALLLLASQEGGTYQGEFKRVSGKDALACFKTLMSMMEGEFKQKVPGHVRNGRRELSRMQTRHGRGWLKRTEVSRKRNSLWYVKDGSRRRKWLYKWRWTLTDTGRAALQRWLDATYAEVLADDQLPRTNKQWAMEKAEKIEGWFTIAGFKVEQCVKMAMALWSQNWMRLDDWENIKRGRDLRFPGWGPCDIKKAVKSMVGRGKLCRPVSPGQVQIRAYGSIYYSSGDLIQNAFPPEWVEWLGRYKGWWLEDLHPIEGRHSRTRLSRIDEVAEAIRHGLRPDRNPEALLTEVERIREEEEQREAAMEDAEYAARQKMPFTAKAVFIEDGDWRLSTVTTKEELMVLGKELHNCVGGYDDHCQKEGCLVAVLRDAKGKAIACGSWNRGAWEQVAETCNKAPSRAVDNVFKRYGKQLAKMAFAADSLGEQQAPVEEVQDVA